MKGCFVDKASQDELTGKIFTEGCKCHVQLTSLFSQLSLHCTPGKKATIPIYKVLLSPDLGKIELQTSSRLLLQPLRWCCVDCVIHYERHVREEQKYICVELASNSKRDCDA